MRLRGRRSHDPVIGIDASRLSVSQRTGTEHYTYEILRAMAAIAPDEAIRLYLNAPLLPQGLNLPWEVRSIPFPRFWTHGRLSYEMLRQPPELLWVPAHVIPLIHPPSVVTIHDLGYLHAPETHTKQRRRELHLTTRWSVKTARHIIAISETTKRDLVERYHVAPLKISVAPHGVSDRFVRATQAEIAELRHRRALPGPFILAVGTVQPRKNYAALARMVAKLRASGLPHTLVIAGKQGWMSKQVIDEIAGDGNTGLVRFLGYLDDADLPALYSAADIVAFPSRYEGFGLPAIEAMACGTPVVVSNRGALPEVAANAALHADPADEDEFASALRRGILNSELRDGLIERGLLRAQEFTWERSARLTLSVLHEQAQLA